MSLTPGTYLRLRREAAGLTLEALALQLETLPRPVSHASRVDWLRAVEAGEAPVDMSLAAALWRAFPFDPFVLIALLDAADGRPWPEAPRLCRVCACSQQDACARPGGRSCHWVAADLCSRCAVVEAVQ